MAGRMAGRAEHAQDGVPETDFGRRVEVGVHRGHLADGHAEDAAARRGVVQQEGVLERHGERDAVAFFEVGDAQRVVEVAVGVGRQDGPEPVFGDEIVERGVLARVAVAGVDDDGFERVVPDDIGVFLDRIELKAGYFHGAGVFFCGSCFRKDSAGRMPAVCLSGRSIFPANIVLFAGFYLSL